MAQERLGVFPHLEGLARITEGDADPLTILSSWGKKWQENHSLRVARTLKEPLLKNPGLSEDSEGPSNTDTDQSPTPEEKLSPGSEWWVHQVRSMNLKLPLEEEMEVEENLFEDEETLEFIATHLKDTEKKIVINSVIQIPEGEVEPEVDTPESLLKKS